MQRILVVSNMYPSSANPAFGVFVRDRVVAFRRLGIEVRAAAVTDPGKSRIRIIAKYLGLFARALGTALIWKPDVIEGHYLVPTAPIVAVVGLFARRPISLYAHGSDAALPHGKLVHAAVRWAVSRAILVQTNSDWTASLVLDRFGREATVIPPGVDPTVFYPPRDGERRSGVVFAGGLYRHKGADVLLDALSRLPEEDWTLTVVGDGPERHRLETMASELDLGKRVVWTGTLEHADVAELFRRAAVVAVPSRRDALGLAAIEALACGTPVVVTSVGGLAGIPDAKSGSVVPTDDPQAMAEAIQRWLTTPREGLDSHTTGRVSNFSMDRVAALALNELRAALPERR